MNLIEDELNAVERQLCCVRADNENIETSLRAFLNNGSKRIRTQIASLYLKSFCNGISNDSITVMAATELIHNASLLQDDVIDRAKMRRGKKTFAEEYSPYVSILLGDYLLSIATEKLMTIGRQDVLTEFLNCTKKMCTSEINQFFSRGNVPEIDDYIEICNGKTAALFGALLKSCAVIEGIDSEKAVNFAKDFGILFQLKNDLEEVSAKADNDNKIFTPKDFLGIEKTMDLIDNYQRKLLQQVSDFPDNIYKKGMESLLSEL